MKKIHKVLLTSFAILTLTGCGTVPKLKTGEEVIAKTDEGNITVESVYEILKEKYGTETLIDLIDHKLFDEKYKEGVTDYVNEQIEEYTNIASQYGLSLNQYIQSTGYSSLEEFQEYLKLTYKRNQAVYKVIDKTITNAEIKEYYKEEMAPDINCKHILISVDTTSSMTEDEKQQAETKALNKAKEVIKKLDDGKKWDDLAKEYSTDESNKDNGGSLGFFNKGDMVEEFEEAAYNLKKNEYTKEPVKTQFGYHIILKTDEKKKASLSSVKEEIIETLREEKLKEDQTLYYKTLEKIRKDNGLDIIDDDLKDDYRLYMNKYTQ